MAAVAITRFELDDDPDKATFDMKIGGSVFRQWRMRRYGGADGVRHFVDPPARKVGDEWVATVEFPLSLTERVEASALDAFEDARRRRGVLNAIRDTEGRGRGTT